MRIISEAFYNFDKHGLRGCQVEILPFLRIFPPKAYGGYSSRRWTIHFGWLYWTVMFFLFEDNV